MQLRMFLLTCTLHFITAESDDRKVAFLNGDFVIGVLLPIHYAPDSEQKKFSQSNIQCGTIREDYGIQRIEAVFHTIDVINNDSELLPNIKLGVEIRDECWYAPVALQQSLELVRDSLTPSHAYYGCSTNISGLLDQEHRGSLIGVIGPGSSSVALQVQNLLQLFQLPQIGYSTTSKDLSDKIRFGYFLRVVPSDFYQAQVILDILRSQGWTYVSAVNTDENYGQAGIQAFRELASAADVCIAKEDFILSNANNSAFDKVIRTLAQDPNAVVVVCFCEGMTVRGLLQATRRLNMTNRFMFIGSDGWGDRTDVIKNLTTEAWGSIIIKIRSPYVEEFTNYYKSLHIDNNTRNPWFREFWEAKFNCSLNEEDNLKSTCHGDETLEDSYRQDSKLSFVIKAIYTFAHGLHNMLEHVCGKNFSGVCSEMQTFKGSLFKEFLMNATFDYQNETIEFNENGDPPASYDILNYQKLENGSFDYVNVGKWREGTLMLFREFQFKNNTEIVSVCSKPCGAGQYAQIENKKCCWTCINCTGNEISKEQSCKNCNAGSIPNGNRTACEKLPIIHTEWYDPEAITTLALSIMGFIAATYSLIIFIKYNNTPVVKSSTRELSYIILIGMMIAYASIFPIIAKPSALTCSLCRILPGLGLAMMYGALLTKTNRIARILAGSKKTFPTRKRLFMSTTSQLCITVFLIGVEVIISAWMLIEQPPDYKLTYHKVRTIRECNTTAQGITIPLTYIFFLILLCTLYALKTRNVPENFNEAKFIGFAMYTTCVIWIAFFSIYFGSDAKVITFCISIILSAVVTWVFLFVPKLYIILLRPERNNRSFFTTDKTIRCHIGSKVSSVLTTDKSSAVTEKSNANNNYTENINVYKGTKKQHDIPERRTLSCQTGVELLNVLLNPKSLIELHSETRTFVPRITEQNCCQGNECELRNITIRLPDARF